jgi:hypothetical protein
MRSQRLINLRYRPHQVALTSARLRADSAYLGLSWADPPIGSLPAC